MISRLLNSTARVFHLCGLLSLPCLQIGMLWNMSTTPYQKLRDAGKVWREFTVLRFLKYCAYCCACAQLTAPSNLEPARQNCRVSGTENNSRLVLGAQSGSLGLKTWTSGSGLFGSCGWRYRRGARITRNLYGYTFSSTGVMYTTLPGHHKYVK